MQIELEIKTPTPGTRSAYMLAEVMVAVAVLAVMVVSLYLGISTGFSILQRTRENLRATQILVQRMETLRLYTWDQLRNVESTPTFQTSFTDLYDPSAGDTGGGMEYHGDIQITIPPPASALPAEVSYRDSVALVTVSLRWTNRAGENVFPHERQFQTLVAKTGMQRYVYGYQ